MTAPHLVRLLCLLATLAAGLAQAQAQVPERLQADVREAIVRVPARVEDAFGKPAEGELLVTTFRPAGPGPFPLAVISHGRDPDKRAEYRRPRYESAARYFVRKGFAVAVPLRLGYGVLASAGDPENSVSCDAPRFGSALHAAAQQILAVRDFMSRQPDIDASRTVLLGVSVGGIATIAATSAHAPGQVAAINFAGGHGGNPEKRPGSPCQSDHLRRLYRAYAEDNARVAPATPTLWVYAENDRYFGPNHASRWARAYANAGGAVDLRVLPPFGEDGHALFTAGNDVWQPLVDEFLKPLGFEQPGSVAAPAPVLALTGDASPPPGSKPTQIAGFQKFLTTKSPRAFAFDGNGHWGYANGDDARSRALARCRRNIRNEDDGTPASTCHLYAVDDAIVWSTP
ncbi:alpha/beta hydrolase family protein [Roseateles sp. LYH14W]|uniref:Alpha/beta hydrolase family protein n=1 Tax=Pelomonas parva TaxID=3299032 RepID=A0ABW7F313_9BURK